MKSGERSVIAIWQDLVCSYLLSNSVTSHAAGIAEYSSRTRCMKTDFQTPNSNSWRRSTASILKGLSPKARSFSANEFYQWDEKLERSRDIDIRTNVGTQELAKRRRSTAALATLRPSSYTKLRAVWIISPTYDRPLDNLFFMSCTCPSLCMSAFWMRHRGHGQSPLFRTVARRTLEDESQLLVRSFFRYP